MKGNAFNTEVTETQRTFFSTRFSLCPLCPLCLCVLCVESGQEANLEA